MPDFYTTYMEALASGGYIVFSVSHPYHQPIINFPDGKSYKLLKKKAALPFLEVAIKERYDT